MNHYTEADTVCCRCRVDLERRSYHIIHGNPTAYYCISCYNYFVAEKKRAEEDKKNGKPWNWMIRL